MALQRTYLDACLKDGLTVRWPDAAMPLKVYIPPFTWYEKSKQNESYAYTQLIMECLNRWQEISQGKIRFQIVNDLNSSQINFAWRRVDRKSLGHCEYAINKQYMLYSAEIQIGISDGVLHNQYNDMDEIKHTILHEIGHALGISGHSDGGVDIMYVPHQYGISDLSPRDIETINWLYQLPIGFNFQAIGEQYNLDDGFNINDVINMIAGDKPKGVKNPSAFQKTISKNKSQENPEKLKEQFDILTQMGKFHLSTQNIKIDPTLKKQIKDRFKKDP